VEKKEIAKHLQEKMPSLEIKQNEDMAKHTSFKVGGKADIWIKIKTLEELTYLLQYTKQNNIPLTILGNGSNVIVKDKGIRGIVCQIKLERFEVTENEEYTPHECRSLWKRNERNCRRSHFYR